MDDSIVRGTISRKVVKMIRQAGAKEIQGMLATAPGFAHHYCNACLTDQYSITMSRAEQLQLGFFEPDQLLRS